MYVKYFLCLVFNQGLLLINVIDIDLATQASFCYPFDFYYGHLHEHNIHLTLCHVNNSVQKNNV